MHILSTVLSLYTLTASATTALTNDNAIPNAHSHYVRDYVQDSPGILNLLTSAYAPLTVNNYGYLGCYTDLASNVRLLSTPMTLITTTSSSSSMTLTLCVSSCSSAGYNIAGVSRSSACWCGTSASLDASSPPNQRVDISGCDDVCPGIVNEVCGGGSAGRAEGKTVAFVSVYSADQGACFWNGTDGRGVFCDGQGDRIEMDEYAAAQIVARDVATSSYVTAQYTLPPSAVFMAPVTTAAANGYSPAAGGNGGGSSDQYVNAQDLESSGYLTVENGATCRVPNVVVVTTNATVVVSSPSTGSATTAMAESTPGSSTMAAQTSAAAAPSPDTTIPAMTTPTTTATYSTAAYALAPSQAYVSAQPVGSAAYARIEQMDAAYSAVY